MTNVDLATQMLADIDREIGHATVECRRTLKNAERRIQAALKNIEAGNVRQYDGRPIVGIEHELAMARLNALLEQAGRLAALAEETTR